MLTDLRISLGGSGVPRPCSARMVSERSVGIVGVEFECASGEIGEVVGETKLFDGVRIANFDDGYDDDANRAASGELATPLRLLGAGKSGRAEVGGGKAGRGILTAIAGSRRKGPEPSRADRLVTCSSRHPHSTLFTVF